MDGDGGIEPEANDLQKSAKAEVKSTSRFKCKACLGESRVRKRS